MAVLALILSVTAVLVAVGGVADKFFANPERDDRWRLALIALFVRFDETAARLRPAELKSNLLTLLYLTLFIGVFLVLPLYFLSDLMPWAERFYRGCSARAGATGSRSPPTTTACSGRGSTRLCWASPTSARSHSCSPQPTA